MQSTSDLIERLTALLKFHHLEVQELSSDTGTAEKAAGTLGVTPRQIVKSLVLITSGSPLLVLAAGDLPVDLHLVARQAGLPPNDVRMATAREVKDISGFAIGGVPPLGHKTPLATIFDRRLFDDPMVFAAAGSRFRIFAVPPRKLAELTAAQVAPVSHP